MTFILIASLLYVRLKYLSRQNEQDNVLNKRNNK